ncbi:MAG: indolepyruvate oxidoreductase subunit beta [Thermoplasmataceae archaeon]
MQHNIIIAGVGGQGVVTLGLMISNAAMSSGQKAIMSEIHGLAQRGGSVSVDVRIGDYYAPIVPDGDADIIIALEPLEGLRSLKRAGPHTVMVMSTEKLPPVSLGINKKQYPDIAEICSSIGKELKLHVINALDLAREAGNYRAVNTVIAGFLYGLGLLDIPREIIESEISRIFSGKAAQTNLAAFDLGYKAAEAEGIKERAVS